MDIYNPDIIKDDTTEKTSVLIQAGTAMYVRIAATVIESNDQIEKYPLEKVFPVIDVIQIKTIKTNLFWLSNSRENVCFPTELKLEWNQFFTVIAFVDVVSEVL